MSYFFQLFQKKRSYRNHDVDLPSLINDPHTSSIVPPTLKYSSFKDDPTHLGLTSLSNTDGVSKYVTTSERTKQELPTGALPSSNALGCVTATSFSLVHPSRFWYDESTDVCYPPSPPLPPSFHGGPQLLLQRHLTASTTVGLPASPSASDSSLTSSPFQHTSCGSPQLLTGTPSGTIRFSMTPTQIAEVGSPCYNDSISDRTEDTSNVHVPSYPGERSSMREPFVRLNANGAPPGVSDGPPLYVENPRGSSVLAAISVVTNTIVGVAVLGVPWVYLEVGLSLGLVLTFCFAALSIFSMYLLSSVAINYGGSDESFYSLAGKAFSDRPVVGFMVDLLVSIKAVGVGCSYLVVVGDMLPEVIGRGPPKIGASWVRSLSIITTVLLFVLPASLPKRIRTLRYTNCISLICLVYVTGLIIYASPYSPSAQDPLNPVLPTELPMGNGTVTNSTVLTDVAPFALSSDVSDPLGKMEQPNRVLFATPADPVVEESFFIRSAKTLPVFVFMFSCAQNLLSVTNELKRRTISNSSTVIVSSVLIALTVYLVVGLSGALKVGKALVKPDILNCFDSADAFVWIAKALLVISVIFSFPLQCHPFRRSLWVLTEPMRASSVPPPTRREARHVERQFLNWTTVLFVVLTTGLALVVHDLGLVFQIVGVLGSTTMSYLMPPTLYLTLTAREGCSLKRVGASFLLLGSCVLIPSSLYAIIVSRLR